MIEFSCADYSFPLLDRVASLQFLRLLGFDFVDIGLFERSSGTQPSTLMAAPVEFLRSMQQDLHAARLQPSDLFLQIGREPAELSINDPDPDVRKRGRSVFLQALELCKAIGCTHMTGLPGVCHSCFEADFALAVKETAWRLDRAQQAGIVYSIEPHIGSICMDIVSTQEMLSQVEGLSLTLDYGHFICQGEKSSAVHSLVPFASHLHVRGGSCGHLQASMAENTIDFEGMLFALQNQDYRGKLALEYVWTDWQNCNRVDNLSETILLRQRLRAIAAELSQKTG